MSSLTTTARPTAPPPHPFAGELATSRPAGAPGRFVCAAGEYAVPIAYRGVRTFLATFAAPRAALQELLPAGVTARRLYGAMGGLVVQLVDLPDTSIGPYDEAMIGVLADDEYAWPAAGGDGYAWEPPPCYALWLAVSTPLAMLSGQASWGYPKTLADTRWSVHGERVSGAVVQGGRTILACEATRALDAERGLIHMRSLTHRGGELCRTSIRGHCSYAVADTASCELRFLPGSRITETLAQLPPLGAAFSTAYLWNYDYLLEAPLPAAAPSEK